MTHHTQHLVIQSKCVCTFRGHIDPLNLHTSNSCHLGFQSNDGRVIGKGRYTSDTTAQSESLKAWRCLQQMQITSVPIMPPGDSSLQLHRQTHANRAQPQAPTIPAQLHHSVRIQRTSYPPSLQIRLCVWQLRLCPLGTVRFQL